MIFPRYWARASGAAIDPKGKRYRFDLWGWSSESAADALSLARRRLSDLAARVGRGEPLGRYAYGARPLREEIIRTIGEPDDGSEAVVTRNRYGALVLNTAQVPFVDIDVLPESPLARLFQRITGRKARPDARLEAIRVECQRHSPHSFRIYRTKAGYRVLATSLLLDPRSDTAQALLSAFGADPFFVKLCKIQGCFRARLTPKPWRIGCANPPGEHPREDDAMRESFLRWLAGYQAAADGYASCRFLESIGTARAVAESRAVVDEHDRVSRALRELPLA